MATQLIQYIVSEYLPYIQIQFDQANGNLLCVIDVDKATNPAYLRGQQGQEFSICVASTSHKLDPEERVITSMPIDEKISQMAMIEIADWFDKAFNKLKEGDFFGAASCFRYVIDHYHKAQPLAAKIAEQRLYWYCLPLQEIVERMRNTHVPLDISVVLQEYSLGKEGVDAQDFENTVEALEEGLTRMPFTVNLGDRLWILQDQFNECVQFILETTKQSNKPISLSETLRNYYPEIIKFNFAFPSKLAIENLFDELEDSDIKRLTSDLVLLGTEVENRRKKLIDIINKQCKPIKLYDVLPTIFPSIPNSSSRDFIEKFSTQLDNRFVEVGSGYWLLRSLLPFQGDEVTKLFEDHIEPLSTEKLIYNKFFPGEVIKPNLDSDFLLLVTSMMKKNRHLIALEKDHWFPVPRLNDLLARVIEFIRTSGQPLTLKQALKEILSTVSYDQVTLGLTKHLSDKLEANPRVFRISQKLWIHESFFEIVVNNAYDWLAKNSSSAPIDMLLEEAFRKINIPPSQITKLKPRIERRLREDERFFLDRYTNEWSTVSPDQKHNTYAYKLLTDRHVPLTLSSIIEGMREEYELIDPQINLDSDKRFREWSDGRWAINEWVLINDEAYEYLINEDMPRHIPAIVSRACEKHNIPLSNAIFLPEEDKRFVQHEQNRWGCRYILTQGEVDRLLKRLEKASIRGLPLDVLTKDILLRSASATDAQEKLSNDKRFVFFENRWYSHSAFHSLTSGDLDNLFKFLKSLPENQLPISIEEFIQQSLGLQHGLTNASERLAGDSRFKEVHSGFWALADFEVPDIERGAVSAPAVQSESKEQTNEDRNKSLEDILGVDTLTRREQEQPGGRKETEEQEEDSEDVIRRTLSLSDVTFGNIRIPKAMKDWISDDASYLVFLDETGYKFLGTLNSTKTVVDLSPWIERRSLTYGDKFIVRQLLETHALGIEYAGKRDERVYQEALKRQDVKKLIEEARTTNKTYHDLMIEVMEAVGAPLHREDIYELVDYKRTASRNTIFNYLSLSDCPYEELRYFVSEGNGYWSFDRKRKEAFDMKMIQFEEQVETLKRENARLTIREKKQREHLQAIKKEKKESAVIEVRELKDKIQSLKKQVETTEKKLSDREKQLSSKDEAINNLQSRIDYVSQTTEKLQKQNESLDSKLEQYEEVIETLTKELEEFKRKHQELEEQKLVLTHEKEELTNTLQVKEQEVEDLNLAIQHLTDQMQQQHEIEQAVVKLRDKYSRVQEEKQSLAEEVTTLRTELEDVIRECNSLRSKVQASSLLKADLENMRGKITSLEAQHLEHIKQKDAEISRLKLMLRNIEDGKQELQEKLLSLEAQLAEVYQALQSPFGRIFARIVNLKL